MHRRLVEPALQALDEERAVYFYDLIGRVERDARTNDVANLVYLTLRESIPILPPLVEANDVIEELFKFIAKYRIDLEHRIHSPRFVVDPTFLRPMIMLFVKEISDLVWRRVETGEISADGAAIWRMEWPYEDDQEFPYLSPEEEDALDNNQAETPEEKELLDRLTALVGKGNTGKTD